MKVKTHLKAGQGLVVVGNISQTNDSTAEVTQSNSVG
jgi:hypothetical protein